MLLPLVCAGFEADNADMEPGSNRPLSRISAGALRLVVRDLPANVRDGYELELRERLAGMSGRQRAAEIRRQFAMSTEVRREQSQLRRVGVGLSWRCVLSDHRWRRLDDADPESSRSELMECDRCGHRRERADFRPPPDPALLYLGF